MNESCYNRRAQSNSELTQFHTKSKSFSNTFLPFQIKEWTNLDAKIRNLPCRYRFKKSFLIYLKTDENSIFDVHNPIGIKVLNWLILNLSGLKEHNFRHNFRNTANSLCLGNAETETISHYLLLCPLFSEQRTKLLESLSNLENALSKSVMIILEIFYYMDHLNIAFLQNTVTYVELLESAQRFNKRLFWITYTFHRHMTSFQRP